MDTDNINDIVQRSAVAVWEGNIQHGQGKVTTKSKTLFNTPYSYQTRFKSGNGTNPEELLAAAHAECFTMSVDFQLTQLNYFSELLETIATFTLDMTSFRIATVHLELRGTVPEITPKEFQKIATMARGTCLVSRILNIPISMNATLIGN